MGSANDRSGRAERANLTADQGQLVLDMQFQLFQADFFELLILRKPGFLEQGFELLRIVTMLFFQAAYCFTIRLTVRFQIHRDSSGAGSFPAEPRLIVVRRANLTHYKVRRTTLALWQPDLQPLSSWKTGGT